MFVANTYVGMVWTDQCWGEAQGKDSHTRYGKWLSGCGIKYQYKKQRKIYLFIFIYWYFISQQSDHKFCLEDSTKQSIAFTS